MKFVVKVNERKLLLSAEQVENLIEVIHGCDYYEEKYVGADKGTLGSNKACVWVVLM